MEKMVKKLFFGTSAAVIASLAFAPVTAYLGDSSVYAVAGNPQNVDFAVTVQPTIALSEISDSDPVSLSAGQVGEGSFTATVDSNKSYVIQLSAETPALTLAGQSNAGSSKTIIPAQVPFSGTSSGWGIKAGEAATDVNDYKEITQDPTTFYTGTAGVNQSTKFTYGIGVDSGQASGTYSTVVTVTATTATSQP